MSRPSAHIVCAQHTLDDIQAVLLALGATLDAPDARLVRLSYYVRLLRWFVDSDDWNRRAAQAVMNTGSLGSRLQRDARELERRRKELSALHYALFERHDDLTVAAA